MWLHTRTHHSFFNRQWLIQLFLMMFDMIEKINLLKDIQQSLCDHTPFIFFSFFRQRLIQLFLMMFDMTEKWHSRWCPFALSSTLKLSASMNTPVCHLIIFNIFWKMTIQALLCTLNGPWIAFPELTKRLLLIGPYFFLQFRVWGKSLPNRKEVFHGFHGFHD